ncbi:MAG: T9SS type A sorting domain-containing protein [Bacteroidota bacterium]
MKKFYSLLLLTLCFSGSVFANTFIVSTTSDAGAGSLRQAITSALAAGTGPHIIDATGVSGTISLQSALPIITNVTITINGPSLNAGTLTITRGTGTYRIITETNASGAATLTLNRLILTNGNPGTTGSDNGGGISVTSANLIMSYCRVSGCSSGAEGGGIYLTGISPTASIDNCSITGNTSNRGGGIDAIPSSGGTLTVTNTTISGNNATANGGSSGGGCNATATAATIKNCTISGNVSLFNGAGLQIGSGSSLVLVNSTITGNNSNAAGTSGGGIRSNSGNTITIINSLVVGNYIVSTATRDDVNWTATTNKTVSYSVIGAIVNSGFATTTQSTAGTPGSPAVVNLGALANNGGFGQTHRLLVSIPELAIDKGSLPSPALSTDGRGAARVIDNAAVPNATSGNGSDIGAYEIGNIVWTGASSAVFDNAVNGNWADGAAPAAGATAYILEGPVTNEAVVSSAVTVSNLTLGSGRSLVINSGNSLTVSSTLTDNGTLKGNGTLVNANLTNTGIVAPGTSAGKLSLTGDFNNSTGTMNIELGGATTAGTDYDQFAVSGAATLSGTLNVSFINGFIPLTGNQFVIMTYGSQTGTFTTINLPDISPAVLNVVYNATNITLTVTIFSLPLKLESFTGKLADNNSIELNWKTSSEQNVNKFELEWSKDGGKWEKIGELPASNTGTEDNYSYVHTQPSAINYYRLKMIDLDGKFLFSQILRISISTVQDVTIFPNPAKNYMTVTMPGTKPAVIELISNKGEIVMKKQVAASAALIDISNLSAGIYTVRIRQGEKTIINKLVKQ